MTREQRLGYERRILAAEVETVRLAQRAKRFAEMIERNTKTLDAALIIANFDADKRGHDRLAVEPWMPALASLLDDIAQIVPDDDNQKGLISEKQPKSVVAFDALYTAAGNLRQAQRDYMEVRKGPRDEREEFGRAVAEAADKLDDALALASCDTQPKAGDVQQAPLVSGAVGEAETPKA